MPEDTQTNPNSVQAAPVSGESDSNLIRPPDADASLEEAMNKMFKNIPEIQPTENPLNKPDDQPKPTETKPESAPKQVKAEANDTTLPDPDKIENTSPKKQDGWNSLKNNYKRAHKVITERDQEIIKLKQSLSERGETSTKEVEDLKKQIEELSGYRAMVDIEADPEFSSKFDAPFKKNVESMKGMLKDLEVSTAIIDSIDFNDEFRLKQILGLVITNKDSYKPEQIYSYQKLKSIMEDSIDLLEKRDFNIIEQKTKHKEYVENKKKESFAKASESEGRIIKRLEILKKDIPFLKKIDPKEGATEAEIQQADNHNKYVEVMSQQVQQVLKEMETPEGKVNASVASVAAHFFQGKYMEAVKENDSLKNEIKKISSVTSEGEKTRQPSAARASNGQFLKTNGDIKNTEDAMSEFFVRSR